MHRRTRTRPGHLLRSYPVEQWTSSTPSAGRCATCASRSPTAATSAASTACRRRSSAATTLPRRDGAAHVRGDRAPRARLRRRSASQKIRITGGEPLVRRDLERLVEMLAALDGARPHADDERRAARDRRRRRSRDAGLHRVTVSLDSLDDAIFRAMNDVDFPVARVLEGIDAAAAAGLAREGQHGRQARRQRRRRSSRWPATSAAPATSLRFIEYMDVGHDERLAAGRRRPRRRDRRDDRRRVPARAGRARPTAARSPSAGATATAAARSASSPPSRSRSAATARARGSRPTGKLYTCLFAVRGHDLRALLRGGAATTSSTRRSRASGRGRTDRYSEIRTADTTALPQGRDVLHRRLS